MDSVGAGRDPPIAGDGFIIVMIIESTGYAFRLRWTWHDTHLFISLLNYVLIGIRMHFFHS